MYPRFALYVVLVMISTILIAGCTQPTTSPSSPPAPVQQETARAPALNISVPFAPVPVLSGNGINMAYELELSDGSNRSPMLDSVEVIDPSSNKVLYTAEGDLLDVLYQPAADPPPSGADLLGGTGKLPIPRVSIWFVVSPDAIPDRLIHRITLNRSADSRPALTVTGGEVAVRKDLSPVIFGSPLKGSGWMAMETTSPLTHHFRAQITMKGITRVPQRYAQDWVLLDPVTGKAAVGNASFARNFYGFGKEIYAVANGTVADSSDGLLDFETIYSTTGITVANAAGNYAIVDIGDNKYACYAHMVNGSVRVKKGDPVTEGQVIGLVGNSGNSDIPHLHFQVVTGNPSFLGAEGYPHVYRSFGVTGSVNATEGSARMASPDYSTTRLWSEFSDFVSFLPQPVAQENRLPENNVILRLP